MRGQAAVGMRAIVRVAGFPFVLSASIQFQDVATGWITCLATMVYVRPIGPGKDVREPPGADLCFILLTGFRLHCEIRFSWTTRVCSSLIDDLASALEKELSTCRSGVDGVAVKQFIDGLMSVPPLVTSA